LAQSDPLVQGGGFTNQMLFNDQKSDSIPSDYEEDNK
jgi:hypothetical protein